MNIKDIELNKNYSGTIISKDKVRLSEKLTGILEKPTSLQPGTEVVVKTTKIQYPNTVKLKILGKQTSSFLINSPLLDKLSGRMKKAVSLIKKSIQESRPIILKHHADSDGYAGAVALEKAIYPILKSEHRDFWRYYNRTPLKTPFYDYDDVIRDLTHSYDSIDAGKSPLIIILDTGSSKKDLFSIKKAKAYKCRVIVVDHHKPYTQEDKYPTDKLADVFINPYLAGGDSNLTAGMLGVEISNMIKENSKIVHLAAVSGFGDKAEGAEFEAYLKKTKLSEKQLKLMARCVDFEAYYLRYTESRLVEDILLNPTKEKIGLIINELDKREKRIIEKVKNSKKSKIGTTTVYYLEDLSERGEYPPQGKSTGVAFDYVKGEDTLVLGITDDSITIRTNHEGFDVNELIEIADKKIKDDDITGGGHEFAGTLHFSDSKDRVIRIIEEYVNA